MSGRGRGRGASNSFNREIVERIGITSAGGGGESQSEAVVEPPPLYPPLENRPVPLNLGVEGEYLLALKRDFVEFFHDSPSYLQHTIIKTDIERYSDRYQTAATASRSIKQLIHDWTYLPVELRERASSKTACGKRKLAKAKVKAPKHPKRTDDITNRFEELEKREEEGEDGEADAADTDGAQTENKEGDKDVDSEVEEDVEEEDLDEEMDDGTDYINSYFDNGEEYLDDEDDNLDDGPIY